MNIDRSRSSRYRRRVSCLYNGKIQPLRPQSLAAIHRASHLGGNDASLHGLGRQCRRLVDDTRDALLRWLGVSRREVVFCGSMGEANTLAVLGLAQAQRDALGRKTVVLTHDRSWDALAGVLQRHGFNVRRMANAPEEESEPADAQVGLVCLMWMCEATHTHRDLRPWRAWAQRLGAWWHVDASLGLAQAAAEPCFEAAAAITVGSTPLGGPSGIAALILNRNVSPAPLWGGGGQQRGVRSGTAATPQVAGFGAAIAALQQDRLGTP